MRPNWAVVLMLFPLVTVIGFAWTLSLHTTHLATTRLLLEGGPVEIITFLAFLGAAVAALVAARRARTVSIGVSRFLLLFAIVAFVASMEEISWGQSIFDYDTPAAVERINAQGELNLHNLPGLDELNSFVLPAFGMFGLWMLRRWKRPLLRLLRPPLVLASYFAVITVAGLVAFITEWWIVRFSLGMVMAWLTEAIEMVMGLSCLIYATWKARVFGPSHTRRLDALDR